MKDNPKLRIKGIWIDLGKKKHKKIRRASFFLNNLDTALNGGMKWQIWMEFYHFKLVFDAHNFNTISLRWFTGYIEFSLPLVIEQDQGCPDNWETT
jgi:hypothetical protein